jgi:hypothetical protein
MKTKKSRPEIDGLGAPIGGLSDALNHTGRKVDALFEEALAAGEAINRTRHHTYSKTGWHAENLHTLNFNVAAAEKGRGDLHAALSERNHPTTDIRITKNGKVLKSFQSKYCKDSRTSYEALRAERYKDVEKLVPVDQFPEVVDIAATAQKAGRRPSSAARVRKSRTPGPAEFVDSLKADAVEAPGVTYQDACVCAKGDMSKTRTQRHRADVRHSAKSAAKAAALVGGSMSAVRHTVWAVRGEEKPVEALGKAAAETVVAAGSAAVAAAGGKVLEKSLSSMLGRVVGRFGSSGCLAVAQTIVTLIHHAMTGRLTWAVALEEIALASAGLSGAELGAIVGTAITPGAGTLVGGLVGGLGGQFLMQKALQRIRKRQAKRGQQTLLEGRERVLRDYGPSANDGTQVIAGAA